MHYRRIVLLLVFCVIAPAFGCRSMYYSTMEVFGREKRQILSSRIEDVSDEQNKAAEEFTDALTRLKEMHGFDGGDLEKMYRRLLAEYEDCSSRAESVRKRIDAMDQVARDLFKEWDREIDEISRADFRASSQESLRETRERYGRLEEAVNLAADRMDPVLQQLKDYVLYLKHNLNAQAIGSLKVEADKIEAQVDQLIRDIQTSIGEAEEFLRDFENR